MTSKEKKKLWIRERRAKEKRDKNNTDGRYMRDALRVTRLSENQLLNLLQQIDVTSVNYRGLDHTWEKFACHETSIRVIGKDGYEGLRSLSILRSVFVESEQDNPEILSSNAFMPGGVVLMSEGHVPADASDQVSHLCDNAKCVRVEHLVWESSYKNNRRKNCPGWVKCRCCDDMHDACVHEPPCKKVTRRE